MPKIYQSLLKELPTGGGVTPDQVKEIVNEMLQSMQNYIHLGEGLAWEDETSNTIKVTNKVNGLNGTITLNPDDFINESNTIKIKK